MHMADALVSPVIGGAAWLGTVGSMAYAARRLKSHLDDRRVPLMGVLGAFVFAAQMINFTIPGTGSSGHLTGGMLLAILLGPHAALLCVFSILAVQALFFADGGLLALGCNVFNLGIVPAYLIYPLIFVPLAGGDRQGKRFLAASVVASLFALQAGAFGVVLETTLSGIADLPLTSFAPLMAAIHLPIGLVEGVITALVIGWVSRRRPDVLDCPAPQLRRGSVALLLVAALLIGGIGSWYASEHPDGLEWSIARIAGEESTGIEGTLHRGMAEVQEKTALLPDYATADGSRAGTSLAGLLGGLIVLVLIGGGGWLLVRRRDGQSS